MKCTYDIAILGGGLLGRALAVQLAQLSLQIALFEQGSEQGEQSAAFVAAAMLAPLAESVESSALVTRLGFQSLPLWKQWLKEWRAHGDDVFFQQNGSLLVWHAQDRAISLRMREKLKRAVGRVHSGGQTAGSPTLHAQDLTKLTWQEWRQNEIKTHEPQLFPRFEAGMFLPYEGQLDNRATLAALLKAAQRAGVDCYFWQQAGFESLKTRAKLVIDCSGIGAKTLWNQRSKDNRLPARLRGVRGEVARVFAPEVTLNRPVRLLHPRYPLYIAPKSQQRFVIGATQLESEDAGAVSVRGALELLSALYSVHPAFSEARIEELAAGLRPTLSHDDPEIRYSKNLIEINGLYRHGFMITPAVVMALVRHLPQFLTRGDFPETDSISGLNFLQLPAPRAKKLVGSLKMLQNPRLPTGDQGQT